MQKTTDTNCYTPAQVRILIPEPQPIAKKPFEVGDRISSYWAGARRIGTVTSVDSKNATVSTYYTKKQIESLPYFIAGTETEFLPIEVTYDFKGKKIYYTADGKDYPGYRFCSLSYADPNEVDVPRTILEQIRNPDKSPFETIGERVYSTGLCLYGNVISINSGVYGLPIAVLFDYDGKTRYYTKEGRPKHYGNGDPYFLRQVLFHVEPNTIEVELYVQPDTIRVSEMTPRDRFTDADGQFIYHNHEVMYNGEGYIIEELYESEKYLDNQVLISLISDPTIKKRVHIKEINKKKNAADK